MADHNHKKKEAADYQVDERMHQVSERFSFVLLKRETGWETLHTRVCVCKDRVCLKVNCPNYFVRFLEIQMFFFLFWKKLKTFYSCENCDKTYDVQDNLVIFCFYSNLRVMWVVLPEISIPFYFIQKIVCKVGAELFQILKNFNGRDSSEIRIESTREFEAGRNVARSKHREREKERNV